MNYENAWRKVRVNEEKFFHQPIGGFTSVVVQVATSKSKDKERDRKDRELRTKKRLRLN